jgi:N-hydroxyarylamine O-acetyltransferase
MLSAGAANAKGGFGPDFDHMALMCDINMQPYEYSDNEEMCRYHQTSPQSHFTHGRICSRATPDGRVTLSEMRLIITRKGEREERELTDEEEYAATLRERFGVALTGLYPF